MFRLPWISRKNHEAQQNRLINDNEAALERVIRDHNAMMDLSRRTCELVAEERDRLRDQNDKLLDHLHRMDRIEHGVAEVVRKPKEKDPMPPELAKHIAGFAGRAGRAEQEAIAKKRRANGESWGTILADVIMEPESAIE